MLPSAVCIRTAQGICPKIHACGQTQMSVGQGISAVTPGLGPGANFRSKHPLRHCGKQARKSSCSGHTGKAKEITLAFLPAPVPTHHALYATGALLEMKASNSFVRQNIRASPCISSLGVRRDSVWAGYIYKTAVSNVSVAISSQC